MTSDADLRLFALAGLAHHCAQETDAFFRRRPYDPSYCFELFRRAIVERSEQAWKLLYGQYRRLVSGWAERHSAFAACGEETQYIINRAFERMWSALTAAKFNQFPDLKSLLRYLQMCVHSVILDQVRKSELRVMSLEELGSEPERMALRRNHEYWPQDRLQREEFWRAIETRLKSEQERRVLYGSFVLGLKPREICAQWQDLFVDVREVYRAKENVLARLRRDSDLKELLAGDA